MITLHLNHVEVLFFIVAVITLCISVYTLREAMMDQAEQTSGPGRTVADANIRQEWFKIAGAIIMLCAAVLALFLEPPPPSYNQVPQSLVFAVAWVLLGLVMIIASLLDKSMRRRLIREFQEMRNRRITDQHPGKD